MRGCLSLAQGFRPPSGDLAFQGSVLGHSGRAGGQHTLHGQARALRTALFLSPRPVALSPFSGMSLAISAKAPQGALCSQETQGWAQTLSSMGTEGDGRDLQAAPPGQGGGSHKAAPLPPPSQLQARAPPAITQPGASITAPEFQSVCPVVAGTVPTSWGLQPPNLIRLSPGDQTSEVKGSQGCAPSRGSRGGSFQPLAVSWGSRWPWAGGHLPPVSASVFPWLLLCVFVSSSVS